jgi:flagellar basal-body rod protein FlgC
MSNLQISQIVSQGLDFERSRLELATLKLSLMNISFATNTEALSFVAQLKGDAQFSTANELSESDLVIKQIKDLNNPLADESGNVFKFDVDPTREMATLISATRAYEANVRAYNANSQMNKAALEIGNR